MICFLGMLLIANWLDCPFIKHFELLVNDFCLCLQDAKGKDVDLSAYKGKVLLIVNVASQW